MQYSTRQTNFYTLLLFISFDAWTSILHLTEMPIFHSILIRRISPVTASNFKLNIVYFQLNLWIFVLTVAGPTQCNSCQSSDAAQCTTSPRNQVCATDGESLGTTHCGTAAIKYVNSFGPNDTRVEIVGGCFDCAGRLVLRRFDTVFQRPNRYFSIALKVVFSLYDRYKIFISNWLWIEICENVVLSKIDITMTTINKKLWNW